MAAKGQLGSFSGDGLGFGVAFTLEDRFSPIADEIGREMGELTAATITMADEIESSLNQMRLGMAAIGVGAAAVVPFLSNVERYSSLTEAIQKSNVVFKESAGDVTKFVEENGKAFGQSRQMALDTIATYGNLFTALGMGVEQAAEYSIQLDKLASDLASFNNISVERTRLALRSAMTGEFEPVKPLGIALNIELVKDNAVRMGLAEANKDLNPLVKMQSIYNLIMQQTVNTQGDFIRTSDEYANSVRILTAVWEDFNTVLGGIAYPLMRNLVQIATSVTVALEGMASTRIGRFLLQLVFAGGLVVTTLGLILLGAGATKFMVYSMAGAFTGATRAMIINTVAQQGVIAGFRAMAVAGWAAFAPLIPYIALGAAVAGVFYLLYAGIRNSIEAFRDFEAVDTGLNLFFQRMGGYLTVIGEVWSSWDRLTNTFQLSAETISKLRQLGIYENAIAIGTAILRFKEFAYGVGEAFSDAYAGIAMVFGLFESVGSTIMDFLNEMGIELFNSTSALEGWGTAGYIAGWLLIGVLGLIALKMLAIAGSALVAFAPVLLFIGLVIAGIWAAIQVYENWDKIVADFGNAATKTFEAGKAIVMGLLNGIKSVWNTLTSWLGEQMEKLPFFNEVMEFGGMVGNFMFGGSEPELPLAPATGQGSSATPPSFMDNVGMRKAGFNGEVSGTTSNNYYMGESNRVGQPIIITNQTILDGEVISEKVTEYQEQQDAIE